MKLTKSCFNCTHSLKSLDYPSNMWGPPGPAEAECQNEYVDWEWIESIFNDPNFYSNPNPYEILAEKCGHYDPVLVERCWYCNKEMNEPEWSHEFWIMHYDDIPVCSQKCKDGLEEIIKILSTW